MKLQNVVGTTRPPFDCSSGLAEILIHLKVAERFVDPAEQKKHADTMWSVKIPGVDGVLMLGMVALCRSCSATVDLFAGPNPEFCELHHKVFCTGGIENPPSDVCTRYREAWREIHPRNLTEKITDKLQDFRRDLRDVAVSR